MSYSPLKINLLGCLVQNQGFQINPIATGYMGSSNSLSNYTKGSLLTTISGLGTLSDAIRVAYGKIGSITQPVYDNLISIGSSTIPALGLSKPASYTNTYTGELTSFGFLRLFPYQAYKEFNPGNGSYTQFLFSFNACYAKKSSENITITSINNSQTYLDGIYSNMDDLITSDITGVNKSTFYWGQDLVASGKVIDLSLIDSFGNPQSLLKTIYKNQALTQPLNLALLSAGLTATEINDLSTTAVATNDQLKLIYAAFSLILSQDLKDVCVILNCQTPNLEKLSDLLNPKKLFPNSYSSLTFPVYNSIPLPTNSKTYFLIYNGNSVNYNNLDIGKRLSNILPADIAFAADAFSISMMQIKNIKSANIEKFSQVVKNLENIFGLTNVNGTNVPTNSTLADNAFLAIAKGSGEGNTYQITDFFGTMTSLHYDWKTLQSLLSSGMTTNLASIYNSIYTLVSGAGPYTNLQNLINAANAEISTILATQTSLATRLNTLYTQFGTYLKKEQDARLLVLDANNDWLDSVSNSDITGFTQSLNQYAIETELEGTSQVLENIADLSTEGGNYLIAAMREARNAQRLGLAGLSLDNDVNSTEPIALPMVSGSTLQDSPIIGYPNSETFNDVPIITGAAVTPGSLAGSPETMLVPDNLSILVQPSDKSILTPEQAIADVILCNCDCWDML